MADTAVNPPATLTVFRSPRTVIGRFMARHTLRGAVLWALLLGSYVASKSIGLVKAYPTVASRHGLAVSFSSNTGLEILLGPARHLETVAGYVAWNGLQIMIIVGAIWGLLLATKRLRGEEDAGRWELLLTGQSTARQATLNVLCGLGVSLAAFYAVLAACTVLIGRYKGIDIGVSQALFFDLAVVSGTGLFILIGALTSQLMPTRSRAAGVAATIFGLSFLLRAVGDITSAHWLLDLTPLGWIEKMQPLVGSQPIWLLPVGLLAAGLIAATLWLAGERDLGDSRFSEKDNSRPHTLLLNQPLGLTLRLSRAGMIGWMVGIGLSAMFYSVLTKTAVQALENTAKPSPAVTRLFHESSLASAKAYLGIVFLIMLLLLMAYAASTAGAIRRDEANGYFDNLLVRPVSRWQLLGSRIVFGTAVIALAAFVIGICTWLGIAFLNLGVPFGSLVQASANIFAPAILAFGLGVLAFGFQPRATAIVAYGVLVWSFLIDMLSSGLHLNHWLLDTSVLNQLALAPAVSPNWQVTGTMVALGVICMLLGGIGFARRDLVTE